MDLREQLAQVKGKLAVLRASYPVPNDELPDEFFDREEPIRREHDRLVEAIYDSPEAKQERAARAKAAAKPHHVAGHGHYPELLTDDPKELRRCADFTRLKTGDPSIRHFSCDGGSLHLLQWIENGKAVSGLTLKAERPWRGQQSAAIDTVYTDEAHRRQGLAAALLKYARTHFRKVAHSKDLTDQGRAWKKAVRNGPKNESCTPPFDRRLVKKRVYAAGELFHVMVLPAKQKVADRLRLTPGVPKDPMDKEDATIRRVCLAHSPGDALAAIEAWDGRFRANAHAQGAVIHIYTNEGPVEARIPPRSLLPDVQATGEVWCRCPVPVVRVATIGAPETERLLADTNRQWLDLNADFGATITKAKPELGVFMDLEAEVYGELGIMGWLAAKAPATALEAAVVSKAADMDHGDGVRRPSVTGVPIRCNQRRDGVDKHGLKRNADSGNRDLLRLASETRDPENIARFEQAALRSGQRKLATVREVMSRLVRDGARVVELPRVGQPLRKTQGSISIGSAVQISRVEGIQRLSDTGQRRSFVDMPAEQAGDLSLYDGRWGRVLDIAFMWDRPGTDDRILVLPVAIEKDGDLRRLLVTKVWAWNHPLPPWANDLPRVLRTSQITGAMHGFITSPKFLYRFPYGVQMKRNTARDRGDDSLRKLRRAFDESALNDEEMYRLLSGLVGRGKLEEAGEVWVEARRRGQISDGVRCQIDPPMTMAIVQGILGLRSEQEILDAALFDRKTPDLALRKFRAAQAAACVESGILVCGFRYATPTSDMLASLIYGWLVLHRMDHDASVYTPEQWRRRGETFGDAALLTLASEGPFAAAMNGYDDPGPEDEDVVELFNGFLAGFGLHYEKGFSWSWHFYTQDLLKSRMATAEKALFSYDFGSKVKSINRWVGGPNDRWSNQVRVEGQETPLTFLVDFAPNSDEVLKAGVLWS